MELQKDRNPRRLIPQILDEIAQTEPDKLYAELPISATGFDAGFRRVTYRVLANAVNGVSWWLTETLGPGKDFETLAYIGPNDLGHNLLLLGAVKAGYKMLFTSPRYSTLAQVKLMNAVDCNTLLTPSTGTSPLIDAIAEQHGSAKVLQIPALAALFDTEQKPFPYLKTFEQGRTDPLVVVHTSGTTGFPKPVVWVHDWAAAFARERFLEPPQGFESLDTLILGNRVLSLMPPFHAAHLFASILFTFYCGTTCIYPPAGVPPTVAIAAEAAKHTKVDAITVVPPHIEELGGNAELIEMLARQGVETVFWAGGTVSQAAGDAISGRLKLFNTCGSTEMGMWPVIRKAGPWDTSVWRHMCIHPAANVQFRPQTDDLYSAVVVKNPNQSEDMTNQIQPPFRIFRDADEFDSGDLFSKHPEPDKKHLWAYSGRSDDLQIFKSGGKWHPVTAERLIISQSPEVVQEALLVGTGHAQVVLLLELKPTVLAELVGLKDEEAGLARRRTEILDEIWPAVREVNNFAPLWVKIDRERVVFVEEGKPMATTAKGTVQRKQAVADYEAQIHKVLTNVQVSKFVY